MARARLREARGGVKPVCCTAQTDVEGGSKRHASALRDVGAVGARKIAIRLALLADYPIELRQARPQAGRARTVTLGLDAKERDAIAIGRLPERHERARV